MPPTDQLHALRLSDDLVMLCAGLGVVLVRHTEIDDWTVTGWAWAAPDDEVWLGGGGGPDPIPALALASRLLEYALVSPIAPEQTET